MIKVSTFSCDNMRIFIVNSKTAVEEPDTHHGEPSKVKITATANGDNLFPKRLPEWDQGVNRNSLYESI